MARVLEKGDEGAGVFDKRGGEIFVRDLVGSITERVKAKSVVAVGQIIFLLILTSTAGLGYAFKALSSYFNFK